MTEQEQKAFDQMREALEHCVDSLYSVGLTITASIANEALTASNAVSDMQNCTTEVTPEQREWCLHLHSEKAAKL